MGGEGGAFAKRLFALQFRSSRKILLAGLLEQHKAKAGKK
ncbi:hypothetical protein NPIL_85481, partial [Nephila pilipes]